jgi:hypothetical protein
MSMDWVTSIFGLHYETDYHELQQVVQDKEITGAALRVYIVQVYEWERSGVGLSSYGQIQDQAGLSRRSVQAAVRLLARKHFWYPADEWETGRIPVTLQEAQNAEQERKWEEERAVARAKRAAAKKLARRQSMSAIIAGTVPGTRR